MANVYKGMYAWINYYSYLFIIIMEILRLRCSDKVFYVTIADADIESLGLSIHSLINICIMYHTMVCEKKSYNPNYTKFWAFWQKKMVNRFWQSVDAILEDVSTSETTVWCKTVNLKTTIFQCSKNYGAARLEVAPTMTDLISLKENRPFPCKNLHILCSVSKLSTLFF